MNYNTSMNTRGEWYGICMAYQTLDIANQWHMKNAFGLKNWGSNEVINRKRLRGNQQMANTRTTVMSILMRLFLRLIMDMR